MMFFWMDRKKKLVMCLSFILGFTTSNAAGEETDPQREWHEHCNMSIHTTVDGWDLGTVSKDVELKVPQSGLECKYDFFDGYGAQGQSSASAKFDLVYKPLLMDSLSTNHLFYGAYKPGRISKDEMCKEIDELNILASLNEGIIKGQAIIRRTRQDWYTPKNRDVILIEQMTVIFSNGSSWSAQKSLSLKGKYCLSKPK